MPNRIILQSDWDYAFSQKDKEIWFQIKPHGPDKTQYCKIKLERDNYVVPEGTHYSILSPNIIQIKAKHEAASNEEPETVMTFIAPVESFSHIHTPKKTISTLDVTEGGLAVSADSGEKMCIWEAATGEVRRVLSGHIGEVYVSRFFPSGVVVLSGGMDMSLRIWCATKGICAATLLAGPSKTGGPGGHTGPVHDVAFVDKGRNVVSGSKDGSVRLWDIPTKTCITAFHPESNEPGSTTSVNCCVVQSAASLLKTAVVDASSTQGFGGSDVSCVKDKVVLTGTEKGKVICLDLASNTVAHSLLPSTSQAPVNTLTFMESEWTVAVGDLDGQTSAWDLRKPDDPLWSLNDNRRHVLRTKMLRTQEIRGLIVTTGDGSCILVNPCTGKILMEFSGASCDPLTDVSFDSKYLYTCCRDTVVRKYELPTCIF